MGKISTIKGYDQYGYEVIDFSIPPMDDSIIEAMELAQAFANMGISACDAAEAVRRTSEAFSQIQWASAEITAIKDSLNDLQCKCSNQDASLESRTAVLEMELNDLRSAMDASAENLNQKIDLEISKQKGARRLLPIIEDRIIPIDTKDLDDWYGNFLKELGYNE